MTNHLYTRDGRPLIFNAGDIHKAVAYDMIPSTAQVMADTDDVLDLTRDEVVDRLIARITADAERLALIGEYPAAQAVLAQLEDIR